MEPISTYTTTRFKNHWIFFLFGIWIAPCMKYRFPLFGCNKTGNVKSLPCRILYSLHLVCINNSKFNGGWFCTGRVTQLLKLGPISSWYFDSFCCTNSIRFDDEVIVIAIWEFGTKWREREASSPSNWSYRSILHHHFWPMGPSSTSFLPNSLPFLIFPFWLI